MLQLTLSSLSLYLVLLWPLSFCPKDLSCLVFASLRLCFLHVASSRILWSFTFISCALLFFRLIVLHLLTISLLFANVALHCESSPFAFAVFCKVLLASFFLLFLSARLR